MKTKTRPAPDPVRITPLDPDSPGGRAASESLSQALAEILVAIRRREAQANTARRAA